MSDWTIYASLIALTAGTVLYLFLTVLILAGHLRRRVDWLLFLAALAAFLFYSGRLLLLNAYLQYGAVPDILKLIVSAMVNISVFVLLPVCFHLQAETLAHTRDKPLSTWLKAAVVLAYVFSVIAAAWLSMDILLRRNVDLLIQIGTLWYQIPIFLTRTVFLPFLVGAVALQWKLVRAAASPPASRFHKWIFIFLAGYGLLFVAESAFGFWPGRVAVGPARITVLYWYLLPGAVAASFVLRHDLPRFSAKRNVMLTVAGGFLAVLYLTLTQRIAGWLEPWFPPVATTSILVFVLVFLFEPIQRRVSRSLQRMMHGEVAKLQRLTAEIQNEARGGELGRLVSFAEERIRAEFSLAGARLCLRDGPTRPAVASGKVERFVLRRPAPAGAGAGEQEEIGVLEAYYYGAMLSGETHAALETLARQLPAAIDLCRLIEEKLTLERELAERERMALLGQMAASISHNLKNPLGSMKTLLQVQLENPSLPESLRKDCAMVVAEIDRLSGKLTQLLHYARPAVRAGATSEAGVDAALLAEQIVELLQRDAQRRNITVTLTNPGGPLLVRGAQEAVSDILQNLIVNAVEAVSTGGKVSIALEPRGHDVLFSVTDDGAGIPADLCAKMFQPFFTTKPAGTGLGLAIVQRRLAELGGSIAFESPALTGRGTRFVVTLAGGM